MHVATPSLLVRTGWQVSGSLAAPAEASLRAELTDPRHASEVRRRAKQAPEAARATSPAGGVRPRPPSAPRRTARGGSAGSPYSGRPATSTSDTARARPRAGPRARHDQRSAGAPGASVAHRQPRDVAVSRGERQQLGVGQHALRPGRGQVRERIAHARRGAVAAEAEGHARRAQQGHGRRRAVEVPVRLRAPHDAGPRLRQHARAFCRSGPCRERSPCSAAARSASAARELVRHRASVPSARVHDPGDAPVGGAVGPAQCGVSPGECANS